MTMKHLKDGEDFGPSHFSKDFGFHGSAEGTGKGEHHPGAHKSKPQREHGKKSSGHIGHEGHEMQEHDVYAGGGHAAHMHPHGHHVVDVEHCADGSVVHHHAHGGHSVHHASGEITHHHAHGGHISAHESYSHGASVHSHPHGHHVTHVSSHGEKEVHHHAHGGHTMHHEDGRVTHHDAHGGHIGHGGGSFEMETPMLNQQTHMAHGGSMHGGHAGFEQENEMLTQEQHLSHGGDVAQDKAMIKKAFSQHDQHMHGGKHEKMHLANGGMLRGAPSAMMRGKSHLSGPHKPTSMRTPRNVMPGGTMPYGVEPSSESEPAGAENDFTAAHGGRARHKRG